MLFLFIISSLFLPHPVHVFVNKVKDKVVPEDMHFAEMEGLFVSVLRVAWFQLAQNSEHCQASVIMVMLFIACHGEKELTLKRTL